MSKTEYDYDKLFMAYEECRSDNTSHFRKIVELQKEIERLKEECSSMGKLLQSGIVISYEEHDEFMKIKSLKSELAEKDAVLEFYANPDTKNTEINNFISDELLNCELGTFIKEDFQTMVGDECFGDKRFGSFQGKRAREVMAKYRGKE